jgi:hypothetical protein
MKNIPPYLYIGKSRFKSGQTEEFGWADGCQSRERKVTSEFEKFEKIRRN